MVDGLLGIGDGEQHGSPHHGSVGQDQLGEEVVQPALLDTDGAADPLDLIHDENSGSGVIKVIQRYGMSVRSGVLSRMIIL